MIQCHLQGHLQGQFHVQMSQNMIIQQIELLTSNTSHFWYYFDD